YILTVFAYGCNLGPTQAARHLQGLATAHELLFTNRRHVSVAQLEAAIKDLVNAYHRCDLPKVWGSGSSAAADGTKYELAENSLLAEYSIRYGGYGGIAYWPILPSVRNRTRSTLLSCTQRTHLRRQYVVRSIMRSADRRWQCQRRAGREQELTHTRVAAHGHGGVRAADLSRR
ncbi:MAG: Tn3 family transposase, partial [Chloroflexi bacterium]|nr:Tn3 family transposase [Chloroflexota bacterium]